MIPFLRKVLTDIASKAVSGLIILSAAEITRGSLLLSVILVPIIIPAVLKPALLIPNKNETNPKKIRPEFSMYIFE